MTGVDLGTMIDSRPSAHPVKRRGPKGRIGSDGFLALLARLDREGSTREEACEALDCSRATYYRALREIERRKAEAMKRVSG